MSFRFTALPVELLGQRVGLLSWRVGLLSQKVRTAAQSAGIWDKTKKKTPKMWVRFYSVKLVLASCVWGLVRSFFITSEWKRAVSSFDSPLRDRCTYRMYDTKKKKKRKSPFIYLALIYKKEKKRCCSPFTHAHSFTAVTTIPLPSS